MININTVRSSLVAEYSKAVLGTRYARMIQELPVIGDTGSVDLWLYALGSAPRGPSGLIDDAKHAIGCGGLVSAMRTWLVIYDTLVGLQAMLLEMRGVEPAKAPCSDCDALADPCARCDGAGVV